MWLTKCLGNNECLNHPNTRLLDNQIRRLRWHFISRYDTLNITLDSYVDDYLCNQAPVTETTLHNYRAMCPWTYVSDTDENRYPMRIVVAKCRCSRCGDNFECKPMFYSIPVLKKECRHGINRWVQKLQYFPVSCYCSRAVTRSVRSVPSIGT